MGSVFQNRRFLLWLLAAISLFWFGYSIIYRPFVFEPRIEERFGFRVDEVYLLPESGVVNQLVVIEYVKFGGRFHQAGFHKGDIVLSYTPLGFYDELSKVGSQDSISFTVGTGERATRISELSIRDVEVSKVSGSQIE